MAVIVLKLCPWCNFRASATTDESAQLSLDEHAWAVHLGHPTRVTTEKLVTRQKGL